MYQRQYFCFVLEQMLQVVANVQGSWLSLFIIWTTVIVYTSYKAIVYHSLVAWGLIQTKGNYNSFLFLYHGSYCKINFSKIVIQICFSTSIL